MDVSLNDRQMNLIFNWKGIQLAVTDRGLEIKSDADSLDRLKKIEGIYRHLADILPYTPISAVGYNLNVSLSKEELGKSNIAGMVIPSDIDGYKCNSQTFTAIKDGAVRSFDIRKTEGGAEIRCNFHYVKPQDISPDCPIFEIIIRELKHFLGYELGFLHYNK